MRGLEERKDFMNTQKAMQPGVTQMLEPDTSIFSKITTITSYDGTKLPLDFERIRTVVAWACAGYEHAVSVDVIMHEAFKNMYDGIARDEIEDALILASVSFIEKDPAYSKVSARLLRKKLFKEVTGFSMRTNANDLEYRAAFVESIKTGVAHNLYDKRMLDFDLEALAQALKPERDDLFEYMGLRTLYERYFTFHADKRIELPQIFWMRVAMGVSFHEANPTAKILEFYDAMSQLYYVPSTPTLLHSGLTRAQLSSCYLATVEDDLHHIFKCIGDQAQLSKWSGGVAYDWSNIRAIGSDIKSIKVESQGLVPFLRISNDTTAAINRSGKRRSASVVYLELWHYEVEDFLDLRKNTGDERRRTHDINTATWIPDLFMKRVKEGGNWTLFSPHEVPDLHHLYGKKFEQRYVQYEELGKQGKLELARVMPAKKLWRKLLSRLFETGHPWITFKDPCNVRSPQDHVGVVHCSNLCTEITLNTSADETAVCNLGSVNLSRHVQEGTLNTEQLARTVKTGMRMLDNVIDINFYPTAEAKNSNMKHRPVGLGQMGLQDALYKLNIDFQSEKALEFADYVSEIISYNAILSSSELAKDRGVYESYVGSKWDRDLFPHDTIALLEQERGLPITVKKEGQLDWTPVRDHVRTYGMRNSNCMAIAPTATISNVAGCIPCIEPIYKNLYVKANMSGEFTVVNKYLVEDLKREHQWNNDTLDMLKYFDGSVQQLPNAPEWIKEKYKEAFEIDPIWLIKISAARGKWIDQSQSHNVFMQGVSGKKLNDIYMTAWECGLKTTYYLRTLGASQNEKSTLDAKKFGFTQKRNYTALNATAEVVPQAIAEPLPVSGSEPKKELAPEELSELEPQASQEFNSEEDITNGVEACNIENPECDVCQ